MPSSKGYRPTAFHVTYARQEQRSSKSPLLIRPAGLTTPFRLHFFPVPLSKNCRALSQESTREVLPCTKCLSLQACYPLSAKRWKSMTSIVCYWYGYDMEHSPTSSRKPFPLPLRRLRREPTSKALCWKPKRFPSLSSVPNADILSRLSRESISLRRVQPAASNTGIQWKRAASCTSSISRRNKGAYCGNTCHS